MPITPITRVTCSSCHKITLASSSTDRCGRCAAVLGAAYDAAVSRSGAAEHAALPEGPAPVHLTPRPARTLQTPTPSRLMPSLADSDAGWARARDGLHGFHLLCTLGLVVEVIGGLLVAQGLVAGSDALHAGGPKSGVVLAGLLGAALIASVVLGLLALAALVYTGVCARRLMAAPDATLSRLAGAQLASLGVLGVALIFDAVTMSAVPDVAVRVASITAVLAFSGFLFLLARQLGVSPVVPWIAAAVLLVPQLLVPVMEAVAPASALALMLNPKLALTVDAVTMVLAIAGALAYRVQLKTLADALDAPRFASAPSSRAQPRAQGTSLVA